MSIQEILAGAGGGAVLLLTLIQITPIKFNPWTAIVKTIGKTLNAEVLERVNRIDTDLQNLKDTVDQRQAIDCRARIVHFGDEIQHDVKHSREHFNAILYDISVYETYCRDHPAFPNEVAVITIDLIKRTFKHCVDTRSFL